MIRPSQKQALPPQALELELCLQLQASLEKAFRQRLAGWTSESGEWGQAFFNAWEDLPGREAPDLETIYWLAARTLTAQAKTGLDRPLARRILADPQAFLMSLVSALQVLEMG